MTITNVTDAITCIIIEFNWIGLFLKQEYICDHCPTHT